MYFDHGGRFPRISQSRNFCSLRARSRSGILCDDARNSHERRLLSYCPPMRDRGVQETFCSERGNDNPSPKLPFEPLVRVWCSTREWRPCYDCVSSYRGRQAWDGETESELVLLILPCALRRLLDIGPVSDRRNVEARLTHPVKQILQGFFFRRCQRCRTSC